MKGREGDGLEIVRHISGINVSLESEEQNSALFRRIWSDPSVTIWVIWEGEKQDDVGFLSNLENYFESTTLTQYFLVHFFSILHQQMKYWKYISIIHLQFLSVRGVRFSL